MNCYRVGCKCDDIKKMYCLYRLTQEQQRVIARIKNYCRVCGRLTVASKYMGQATRLCTQCGTVTQGDRVVRYCLINSRRAS